MFFPSGDLARAFAFMADGVAVVTPAAGGRPARIAVMYEAQTENVLSGDAQSDEMRLRCIAVDLPAARRGDLVQWQGASYRLRRDPERIVDGRELRLALERI